MGISKRSGQSGETSQWRRLQQHPSWNLESSGFSWEHTAQVRQVRRRSLFPQAQFGSEGKWGACFWPWWSTSSVGRTRVERLWAFCCTTLCCSAIAAKWSEVGDASACFIAWTNGRAHPTVLAQECNLLRIRPDLHRAPWHQGSSCQQQCQNQVFAKAGSDTRRIHHAAALQADAASFFSCHWSCATRALYPKRSWTLSSIWSGRDSWCRRKGLASWS